jgi:hypothetical protein
MFSQPLRLIRSLFACQVTWYPALGNPLESEGGPGWRGGDRGGARQDHACTCPVSAHLRVGSRYLVQHVEGEDHDREAATQGKGDGLYIQHMCLLVVGTMHIVGFLELLGALGRGVTQDAREGGKLQMCC